MMITPEMQWNTEMRSIGYFDMSGFYSFAVCWFLPSIDIWTGVRTAQFVIGSRI